MEKCGICGADGNVEHHLFDDGAKPVHLCYGCSSRLDAAFEHIEVTMEDEGLTDEDRKTEVTARLAEVFGSHQTTSCINTIIASVCRAIKGGFADGGNLWQHLTQAVKKYRIEHLGYEGYKWNR